MRKNGTNDRTDPSIEERSKGYAVARYNDKKKRERGKAKKNDTKKRETLFLSLMFMGRVVAGHNIILFEV